MAVENLKGARVMTPITAQPAGIVPVGLYGGRVRCVLETVEVTAGASVGSTYLLARVPANAYPLPLSRLHWDDLADAGSPDIKLGLFGSQISDDDDALLALLDASAVGAGTSLIADIADFGEPFWSFVSGQTQDPGGELDLTATLYTADADLGGTLSLELYYAYD